MFIPLSEVGLAVRAVALCDRGHRVLPEAVETTSGGPFAPRFSSGYVYTKSQMFANALDPNAVPRHASLRGRCSA